MHVILDNFSTHKTELVKAFLQQHPNVSLHFTPTYSSWLNQVETWFSKLQRDVIDRGIFTSVADLKRKILRYIRLYQKTAKPFRWKYSDVSQTDSGMVAIAQGQPTSRLRKNARFQRNLQLALCRIQNRPRSKLRFKRVSACNCGPFCPLWPRAGTLLP